MDVEILINQPHVLQARLQRAADVGDEIRWQVYFLPHGGPAAPSLFTAFCPFTFILATGTSVPLAARAWVKEARRRFPGHSFTIPKYVLVTNKVWYGEKPTGGVGIYAVDLGALDVSAKVRHRSLPPGSSPSEGSVPALTRLQIVGFSPSVPAAIEVIEPAGGSPLMELEDRLNPAAQGGDGLTWAEWRVSCTPVMFSQAAAQSAHFVTRHSLTPHCLN